MRPSCHLDETARTAVCLIKRLYITGKTSIYTLFHFAQLISTGRFAAFDWGDEKENLRRYGQPQPPKYDLGSVQLPFKIFWSNKDSLATNKDVTKLEKELKDIIFCKELDFHHLDYLWGENAHVQLYPDIASVLLM